MKIKYIGTQDNWCEVSVTGNQCVWQIAQADFRTDAECALLLATGLFERAELTPVYATKDLTGVSTYYAAGVPTHATPGYGAPIMLTQPKWGNNRRGFPLAANITAATGLTITGQGGNAQSISYIERDGMRGVRITTVPGFYAEIALPLFSKLIPKGQVEALCYLPDGTTENIASTSIYVSDNAFANCFNATVYHSAAGCSQHPGYFTCAPDLLLASESARIQWAVLAGSPVWSSTTMTTAKLRITPTAGKSATFEFFGMWANGSNTLPSVVFTADDGYASIYTNGIPILEKYGHRLSMGIIADLVGSSGTYMTKQNLVDLVARGHECVVHGPIGGAGSLAANYTTTADILNDVLTHRNYLINNGLSKNGSENIYIFPQGVYQHARDDTRVMDAIRAAGLKYARLANVNQSSVIMVDQRRLPYYIPIIGHAWVSSGTEAANIANIIAKIQEAAANGRSVVLMFHHVTSAAAATSLEIQASNLELICQAVADLESSGTIKNTLLSEMCYEMDASTVI